MSPMLRSTRSRLLRACLLLGAMSGCATEYEGTDLFPLYRDVGDEQAGEFFWPLPPVWSSWDAKHTLSWSFPFHYRRIDGDHGELTLVPLLPLWMRQRSIDADVRAFFPFWHRVDAGVRSETTLLLLLAKWATHSDEDGLQRFAVFPLFDRERKPGGSRLDLVSTNDFLTGKPGAGALFSLFSIDASRPRFGTTDSDGFTLDLVDVFGGLVQLFHHGDAGSHDETRFLTLFASEPASLFRRRSPHEGAPGSDERSVVFFPLWFDVEDREGRFFEFWPFYGFNTEGDVTVRRYVLWPLLTLSTDDRGEPAGRLGFEALFKLLGSIDERGISDHWFWPLFGVKTSERGHDWSVLLGLVGHFENERRSVLRVLWIPFESEPEAAASEAPPAKPADG